MVMFWLQYMWVTQWTFDDLTLAPHSGRFILGKGFLSWQTDGRTQGDFILWVLPWVEDGGAQGVLHALRRFYRLKITFSTLFLWLRDGDMRQGMSVSNPCLKRLTKIAKSRRFFAQRHRRPPAAQPPWRLPWWRLQLAAQRTCGDSNEFLSISTITRTSERRHQSSSTGKSRYKRKAELEIDHRSVSLLYDSVCN